MVTTPSISLFLESFATGKQGHTAEWIAQDIERIIIRENKIAFAGVVTDNIAANKKEWEMLSERFQSLLFQGCVSHGLLLLVKDILAASKTRKTGESEATYPNGYPFVPLVKFSSDCKYVVKFFHNHHAVKAKLIDKQRLENAPVLSKPVLTRWGSFQKCFESLLKSETILFEIVTKRDFIADTAVQSQSDRE
jgi:Protein of unknown function (DUF 659)